MVASTKPSFEELMAMPDAEQIAAYKAMSHDEQAAMVGESFVRTLNANVMAEAEAESMSVSHKERSRARVEAIAETMNAHLVRQAETEAQAAAPAASHTLYEPRVLLSAAREAFVSEPLRAWFFGILGAIVCSALVRVYVQSVWDIRDALFTFEQIGWFALIMFLGPLLFTNDSSRPIRWLAGGLALFGFFVTLSTAGLS